MQMKFTNLKLLSKKKGEIYDILKRLEKYVICIDGASLNVILSNEYLYCHFAFLAFWCKTVIGYELQPQ